MPTVEADTRKIIARLEREGWVKAGGSKHDKFEHPNYPETIVIARRKEQSIGVARQIARAARWI